MAIDLNKYKLSNNLEKYKINSSSNVSDIIQEHNIQADKEKSLAQKAIDMGKSVSQGFQDFNTGTVKGALSTAQGMANLGEKILANTVGKGVNAITGKDVRPSIAQMPKNWTEGSNTMQKIGKGVEQVGEFMIPSAVMSGAGKTGAIANTADKFINSYKAGKFITGAAKLAARMGLGAAETGGITALQTGGDKKATKNAAIIGAAMPVAGAVVDKIGQGMQWTGKKIGQTILRPSAADKADGFKIDNVYKYNLGGTVDDTLQKSNKQMNELGNMLKEKIGQSGESIDLNTLYEKTAKDLGGNNASTFGSAGKINSALEQLKSEINLQGSNGVVDLPTAQTVKRAAGTMGAWKYGLQDPESLASEKVYNTFYSNLKTEIEKKSPAGVKEINKALSEIIPIHNAALKRLPVAERNNIISLTDTMSILSTIFDPKALPFAIANNLAKSGRVANVLIKKGASIMQPSKIAPLIKGAIVKTVNRK